MRTGILLDTGPLVAYLYPRERYHRWAVEQFAALDAPFVTCEPVLTEACFLAARVRLAPARILDLLQRGLARIGFEIQEELAAIRALMQRYADVPMSLADACLVRLAERTDLPILTLDADFSIYRAHGRRPLTLISPERQSLHEP
ncbi:MAG: type II toxin-antitoxin system VapC family toxin [Thiohalocapsa sp.]